MWLLSLKCQSKAIEPWRISVKFPPLKAKIYKHSNTWAIEF